MVEVRDSVIYGDGKGRETTALVLAVHEDNRDILHPWVTLVYVHWDARRTCTIQGTKVRQTVNATPVPFKAHAGPGHYWREQD